MNSFAWLLILVIFVQPIYFLVRAAMGKFNGNEEKFVAYWADFKSWCIRLWDLVKWKVS